MEQITLIDKYRYYYVKYNINKTVQCVKPPLAISTHMHQQPPTHRPGARTPSVQIVGY